MSSLNPDLDPYFEQLERWQAELLVLRGILGTFELEEALKWRQPCYAYRGKNLFILGQRKDACVLSIFNGALLEDPEQQLVSPGENSQSMRYLRFESLEELRAREAPTRAFIRAAISARDEGKVLELTQKPGTEVPEELEARLEDTPGLREAFGALPPGKQRGYILHVIGAKQSQTRAARVDKCIPRILAGKGFHDCICGKTKRPPRCDGSHKHA